MHLTSLSISNFRIFKRLEVELPRQVLLLAGDNAQGKTSFLEAIHLFATLTSLQAQSDRQLINFIALKENMPVGRLVAKFKRTDGDHNMEIRLILEPGINGNSRLRKEVLVDGVKRNLQEALGQFNSVIFLPQMMRILEGGPEERRRYLDMALAQALPGYARTLVDYNQALSQRNALLKQLKDNNGNPDQLKYWDETIAKYGAFIIQNRIHTIHELDLLAGEQYKILTNEKEALQIIYLPAFNPLLYFTSQQESNISTPIQKREIGLDDIRSGFENELKELRNEEIARGVTTIGPHRDDLCAHSNGIDLGMYGSRGQIRSAILSLKLAELNWLKGKASEWPILLLDETLVELDIQHRANFLNAIRNCDQAILTTTDLHLFPVEFVQHCTVWQMANGQVDTVV